MSNQNWQNVSNNMEAENDAEKSGSEIIALSLEEYRKKHRERYQKRLDEHYKLQEIETQQKIQQEQEEYQRRIQEIQKASEDEYRRQLMMQQDGTDHYVPLQEETPSENNEREPMRTGYMEQLISPPTFTPFDVISRVSSNARLIMRNMDPESRSENPTTFMSFLRNNFSPRNVSIGIIIIAFTIIIFLLLFYYWD